MLRTIPNVERFWIIFQICAVADATVFGFFLFRALAGLASAKQRSSVAYLLVSFAILPVGGGGALRCRAQRSAKRVGNHVLRVARRCLLEQGQRGFKLAVKVALRR